MNANLTLGVTLATLLWTGCETAPPPAPVPRPEVLIPLPPDQVAAAVKSTMANRGYLPGKVEGGTFTFDRTADFGPSVRFGSLYDKPVWRRIRITLTREGAGTRVTARGAIVTNRGTADEREEQDTRAGGAHQMQAVLEQIRERAQSGP